MANEEELQKEHFSHICAQTNYFNDKLTEAFTFFVQTYTVIVGGCIWLAIQKDLKPISREAEIWLSNGLVILLTIVTLARVIGNLTAWWGARKMQHKILSSVPLPHRFGSTWLEIILAISVAAACGLFCLENPFKVIGGN